MHVLLQIGIAIVIGVNALALFYMAFQYLTDKSDNEIFTDFEESAADPAPDALINDRYVVSNGRLVGCEQLKLPNM
jgi:hypothetical protein